MAPDLYRRIKRPLTLIGATWRRLRPLYGNRIAPFLVLVGISIAAGLAEAGVLALVASVAAAMVVQAKELETDLGPVTLEAGLGLALGLALALAVLRLVLQLLIAWLPARISSGVQAGLRRELFDAYSRASWSLQSEEREGHLQELMTNQINQATQVVVQVVTALSGSAMFLALAATALLLNVLVAVIILASAVLLFWALRPIVRFGRNAARTLSQANVDHAAGVSESVRLAEEAYVFGAAAPSRRRVGNLIENARRGFFRFQFAGGLVWSVYQSLVIMTIVAGLAALHATGAGNFAALGAVVLMLVRASSYAQQFQGGYQSLNQLLPYLERIESAIARYRASEASTGDRALPEIRTLALEGVTFAYRTGELVLRDITFYVQAGEAIGVVGPSGAGKSTLVQLLLRMRDPDTGAYLVNGEPVESFRRHEWQRRVAYVGQDPRIMRTTVADNIRFFRDLDDDTIERAARMAHIHDDVMRLPAGYDTVVGQQADAVSGGQRQRICLARALAAEPDVLVLDEPTSALDAASEAAVQASLAGLQGRLTLFVVAHRLSTLKTCDRVLVLVDGVVDAFAPAKELESDNAFYRMTTALAQERG